jgi:hypothetical protein
MIRNGAPAGSARTNAQEIERGARDGITPLLIRTSAPGRLRAKNPAWEKNRIVYDGTIRKRTDE